MRKKMLTRKHYKAIAEIIKTQRDLATVFAGKQFAIQRISDIVDGLADYFAQDNPRFDRARFLAACGLEK